MKILFSNPPWWVQDGGALRKGIRAGSRWPFTIGAFHQPDHFKFGGYLPNPLFMEHAAGFTQGMLPDAQIIIRDSIARGEGYYKFCNYVRDEKPDFIVIETGSASLEHDLVLIRNLESKVIVCGPIAKEKQQAVLDTPNVVAVVNGEYDKQVPMIIWKNLRGIFGRDLLATEEMNSALPMRDEAAWDHYWDACPAGTKAPQLQVWSSRGCPFRCCFCVWPATMTGDDDNGKGKRSVRYYSRDYLERLLTDAFDRHPYKTVYFDDDTFNLSDKHVLEVCELMDGNKVPWSAMCRADTIKPQTWMKMYDSGCFGVKIGFESGSQYVIDKIVGKRLNLAEAAKTAKWLQDLGMSVHGTFTIGLPGETRAQAQETLDFIKRLYEDRAISTHQLSGTSVIDGTPLARIAAGDTLDAYAGARPGGSFVNSPDGQAKIEEMMAK